MNLRNYNSKTAARAALGELETQRLERRKRVEFLRNPDNYHPRYADGMNKDAHHHEEQFNLITAELLKRKRKWIS